MMITRPCSNRRLVPRWTTLQLVRFYSVKPQIELSSAVLPHVAAALSRPTWSVRSLLSDGKPEQVKPEQLAHLLRLSALPQPRDGAEEKAIRESLQSQLSFVRSVQAIETTHVEPLAAIRDETSQGRAEATIGLRQLQAVLDAEEKIGKFKRPKRPKTGPHLDAAGNELRQGWDPLKTASKVNGRYILVKTGGGAEQS